MATSTSDESLSPYKTIGGKGSNISRHPSELHFSNDIPEGSPAGSGSINWSRPGSINGCATTSLNDAVLKWDEDEVISWLHETGFAEYEVYYVVYNTAHNCAHVHNYEPA